MTTLPSSPAPAFGRLSRPRLSDRLAVCGRRRVTLCIGREGAGKSVAIREFLDAVSDPYAVIVPSEPDVSLWRFARSIAEAMRPLVPGLRRSFAAVYDQFSTDATPQQQLARWFATHLRDVAATIVIDNFEGSAEPAIVDLLVSLIEREDLRVRWIVSVRNVGLLPIPRWMARGIMEMPIDEPELLFTAAESAELHGVPRVDSTTGLPLAERVAALGWDVDDVAPAESDDASAWYVRAAYPYLPSDLREFLKDALLPATLDRQLLRALGYRDVDTIIARLCDEYDYLFEPLAAEPQFHIGAAALLLEALSRDDVAGRASRIAKIGDALERLGRPADAIAFYERWFSWDRLHDIVERRGLALTDDGAGDVVLEAVRAMPADLQTAGSAATALRALSESRSGRHDTAEAWFLDAISEAGANRDRITYLYACDIMRRHRDDCVGLFEDLIARLKDRESPEFLAEVRSAASEAYMFVGREDDARAAIELALERASASDNERLRSRVYARAAYTWLHLGDSEKAQAFALEAARSAERAGLYMVATGAYSVLYIAAYETDRVIDALYYVGLLAESAVRCGNLDFHLYGLIAAHGIETERRNLDGLRNLYASLHEFEVQYDSRVAVEELIPNEALHATWEGDFERAGTMLAPTIALARDPARRALRTAEVALYAVAAGDAAAARDRLSALEFADGAAGIYIARGRLVAALAHGLLGEGEEALALAESARCERPRSLALKRATHAVLGFWGGTSDWKMVDGALADLYKFEWGGFAAMLASLPALR